MSLPTSDIAYLLLRTIHVTRRPKISSLPNLYPRGHDAYSCLFTWRCRAPELQAPKNGGSVSWLPALCDCAPVPVTATKESHYWTCSGVGRRGSIRRTVVYVECATTSTSSKLVLLPCWTGVDQCASRQRPSASPRELELRFSKGRRGVLPSPFICRLPAWRRER
jgi:hypothetical protein